MGYTVVAFFVCNGSPTCGYDLTSCDYNWGGCPKSLEYGDALVEGQGVYIEELHSAIAARGLELPPFYGLNLDEIAKPIEDIIVEFDAFIENRMKELEG